MSKDRVQIIVSNRGDQLPRYFFHLASDVGYAIDEDGLEFCDLDAAYLDACRAVRDMSVQILSMQQDPIRYRFDIADAAGTILLDIPFPEVLRTQPSKPPRFNPADLRAQIARSRALRLELAGQIARASETLGETQRLLSRR